MSTMVLLKARDIRGIGGGPKALLVALADLAGLDGECTTTLERLAVYTDTDDAAVTRDLAALVGFGLVEVEHAPGGGHRFRLRLQASSNAG
jgi:DNA-binding IscR family transcriptional regulator